VDKYSSFIDVGRILRFDDKVKSGNHQFEQN